MQYIFMLQGEEPNWEDVSPQEMQATIDEMGRYNQELKDAGAMVDGHGLRERATATVVHFPDGEGEPTVTDGPFAETKEQLMGFWIVECANLDEALAWARKAPLQGAAIEVRPLVEESAEEEEISGEELVRRAQEKK
ncbi:MAG TPA: YciI family protein [Solirubrobacterales bacterium]|nr:YciI family protein [Solirubrobacterales bacterium]